MSGSYQDRQVAEQKASRLSSVIASDRRTDEGGREALEGRITHYAPPPIRRSAIDTLIRSPNRPGIVDASRLEYVDDVGIALLFDLLRRDRPADAKVEIRALAPGLSALLGSFVPKDFTAPARGRRVLGIL